MLTATDRQLCVMMATDDELRAMLEDLIERARQIREALNERESMHQAAEHITGRRWAGFRTLCYADGGVSTGPATQPTPRCRPAGLGSQRPGDITNNQGRS